MKPLVFALLALALTGCGAKRPYSILDRATDGKKITISAEVPATSSPEDMDGWCSEITAAEAKGQEITVNFYHGGRKTKSLGTCNRRKF